MTLYAHVTNGEVDGIGLPDVWRRGDGSTVSGYQFAEPADLAADGWLPIVEDRPDLAPNEMHGPPTYAAGDGQVTATYPVEPVPIPDLPADPDLIPPDPTRLRSPR